MWRNALVGVLGAAVLLSAVAVVHSQHVSRKLFTQLQGLQAARDALDVEWGKLQLEQSTWATDGRIERTAHGRLNMVLPLPRDVVIVRP